MSKLIAVTVNEAFELIKDLDSNKWITTSIVPPYDNYVKRMQRGAFVALKELKEQHMGAHSIMIHFEGIEEVRRKKSELEGKIRLDSENASEILEVVEEHSQGLFPWLEVSVRLSRNYNETRFFYTVSHIGKNETASLFADVISKEITKLAKRVGILEKVTVSLEENEADDYDPNDEAEQDR